jgi:CBS-domain-containing membrane protein
MESLGPKRGTVGSIMSGRVVTVQPDTAIRDAMELFAQGEVQAVPVINAQGQLLGILTANDLLREALR